MNDITQTVLDDFSSNLKKIKYKNKIQDLKLEYCNDSYGNYIYLVEIKIKNNARCKGYGSLVMSELIDFANTNKLRIKLYVSPILGGDVKRLYEFYSKLGFFSVKNKLNGYMLFNPK